MKATHVGLVDFIHSSL